MPERDPKVVLPAQEPPAKPEHSAALIFIHGFGDDAQSYEAVGNQFQSINKLPYMQWVIPNAMDNRDAMDRAWDTPTGLTALPPSRPELQDDEDEDGMMQSQKYLVSLIDELASRGVPANRIVVGGFSQGHVMALLIALTSKYAGKLAGIICLCGYMGIPDRIPELRKEGDLPDDVGTVPFLIGRGARDVLVPKRYHTMCVDKLKEFGVKDEDLHVREFENLGHTVSAAVLQEMCNFLEKVVPPVQS